MDEEEIKGIVHEINRSIPGIIPEYLGNVIRESLTTQAIWIHTIPIVGHMGIAAYWRLIPDGSIQLELHSWNGNIMWTGTFRPPSHFPAKI